MSDETPPTKRRICYIVTSANSGKVMIDEREYRGADGEPIWLCDDEGGTAIAHPWDVFPSPRAAVQGLLGEITKEHAEALETAARLERGIGYLTAALETETWTVEKYIAEK